MKYPDECRIGGLVLSPPWMNASGFLATPPAFERFAGYRTGAVVTKTMMLDERKGHESPVFVEGEDGSFYNAVGLAGQGADNFREELSRHYPLHVPLMLSVSSMTNAADAAEVVRRLEGLYAGVELNGSCPNVDKIMVATSSKLTGEYVRAVGKAANGRPVVYKLTPAADAALIAQAAAEEGANAILVCNTFPSKYLNPHTGEPHLTFKQGGGKSGRNVRGDVLQKVGQVAGMRAKHGYDFKIGGVGGIDGSAAAKEYFDAGADFLQFGTHLFLDRPMEIRRPAQPELETVKGFLERMEREIYGSAA